MLGNQPSSALKTTTRDNNTERNQSHKALRSETVNSKSKQTVREKHSVYIPCHKDASMSILASATLPVQPIKDLKPKYTRVRVSFVFFLTYIVGFTPQP